MAHNKMELNMNRNGQCMDMELNLEVCQTEKGLDIGNEMVIGGSLKWVEI